MCARARAGVCVCACVSVLVLMGVCCVLADVGNALMASAALPVLLTPSAGLTTTFRGRRVLDGGATSNTPVFTGGTPCSLTHSITHALTHARICTDSLTYSHTHSQTLTHRAKAHTDSHLCSHTHSKSISLSYSLTTVPATRAIAGVFRKTCTLSLPLILLRTHTIT